MDTVLIVSNHINLQEAQFGKCRCLDDQINKGSSLVIPDVSPSENTREECSNIHFDIQLSVNYDSK